jgi:tetratricopeptide (TPR) repeat protein
MMLRNSKRLMSARRMTMFEDGVAALKEGRSADAERIMTEALYLPDAVDVDDAEAERDELVKVPLIRHLTELAQRRGDLADAQRFTVELEKLSPRFRKYANSEQQQRSDRLRDLQALGEQALQERNWDRAEQCFGECRAILSEQLDSFSSKDDANDACVDDFAARIVAQMLSATLFSLSTVAQGRGQLDDAERLLLECRDTAKRAAGGRSDDPRVATALNSLFTLSYGRGSLDDAERYASEYLDSWLHMANDEAHPRVAGALYDVAVVRFRRGAGADDELDEIKSMVLRSIDMRRQLHGSDEAPRIEAAQALILLGNIELRARAQETALAIAKRALSEYARADRSHLSNVLAVSLSTSVMQLLAEVSEAVASDVDALADLDAALSEAAAMIRDAAQSSPVTSPDKLLAQYFELQVATTRCDWAEKRDALDVAVEHGKQMLDLAKRTENTSCLFASANRLSMVARKRGLSELSQSAANVARSSFADMAGAELAPQVTAYIDNEQADLANKQQLVAMVTSAYQMDMTGQVAAAQTMRDRVASELERFNQ